MKRQAARKGSWMIAGMAVLAAASIPGTVSASSDSGFRLELGPDVSYSRSADDLASAWQAGATLGLEAWGLGPLGFMLHASEAVSFGDVRLGEEGFSSTQTWITRVDLGPTLNVVGGPVHFRLGAGPWFGFSQVSDGTLASLDASSFVLDWTQATFLGAVGEARLDVNLPLLSPFAALTVRTQTATAVEGSEEIEAGSYVGRDLQGTVGARVNLVPFVKLGLAAHAGVVRNDIAPTLSRDNVTRYGASVWLVVIL